MTVDFKLERLLFCVDAYVPRAVVGIVGAALTRILHVLCSSEIAAHGHARDCAHALAVVQIPEAYLSSEIPVKLVELKVRERNDVKTGRR